MPLRIALEIVYPVAIGIALGFILGALWAEGKARRESSGAAPR